MRVGAHSMVQCTCFAPHHNKQYEVVMNDGGNQQDLIMKNTADV